MALANGKAKTDLAKLTSDLTIAPKINMPGGKAKPFRVTSAQL
jgi:hypothetical protein